MSEGIDDVSDVFVKCLSDLVSIHIFPFLFWILWRLISLSRLRPSMTPFSWSPSYSP